MPPQLTSRGGFVALGGVFLVAFGLSVMGIRTVATMIPFLGGGGPMGFLELEELGPALSWISYLIVPIEFVDYLMLLGSMMVLGAVVGLPLFGRSTNTSLIQVVRTLEREKAFAGEFIYVTLTITNTSRHRMDYLEIYDAIPEYFELALGENYIITQLGGYERKVFSYIIRVSTRGVYRLGPSKVILHDRLGFYFQEDVRHSYTEVLVYPSYEDVRRMEALSQRRRLGHMFGQHRTKLKGMGDDFHQIRKYYPGDEFRSIDWKAFSRTGQLQVREFETEKNIRMVIFLDHSGSMGGGPRNNTKLDYAIRAAMLLSHMAEERRDLSGLVTFADRPTAYLAPARSSTKTNFFKMLEVLALIQSKGQSNPLEAVEFVVRRLPHASFFIFLTDLEAGKRTVFLEAAKRAMSRKHSMIVIAPFGPYFEAQLGGMSEVERGLTEAIAEEYLTFRKGVADSLRRMGVDVINVSPDDFLPTVIRQYHRAKKEGKGIF